MRFVLEELKRRRVLQVAALYIAIAWAATEMLGFLLPALNFPRWTVTVVAILFVIGFPVAMFLAWVFDVKADGIQRTAPSSARGKLTIGFAISFLLASTVGLFFLIYPQGGEIRPQLTKTSFDPPENSIAVLPFVNMSNDPSNDYFSDGIAEELLHKLARTGELWVTARTSSFQYRDRSLDVRLIGEQLNVAKVLEGSVRKSGNRVRITVQLINTRNGYHDWSETYDRELTDIFQIQDDIAQSVGEKLALKMAVASRSVAPITGQSFAGDLDAYDNYLRGRHDLYSVSEPNVQESIGLLKRAVESEPEFAAAWLTLADAYSMQPAAWQGDSSGKLIMEAARKALALDPSLGEAHALIAAVEARRWQWQRAEQEFSKALGLEPWNTKILRSYGVFLVRSGRIQQSYETLMVALDRDPLSPETRHLIGIILLSRDDTEAAIKNARMAKEYGHEGWQNDHTIVQGLIRLGRVEEAREFLINARDSHGPWFWPSLLLSALQDSRLIPTASTEMAAMEIAGSLAPDRAFLYQSLLGQWDEAHRSATGTLDDRTFPFQDLWLSELSEFRQDPRFAELMRGTGLVDYWGEYGFPDTCTPVNQSIRCD